MVRFERRDHVKIRLLSLVLAVSVILACTGGGGTGTKGQGTVAGIVTDANGGVVRNARVYFGVRNDELFTFSNSSGAFTLDKVPEGIQRIKAEVFVNGIRYYGENDLDVFANERSKSLNIVIGRQDQLARMRGKVFDRDGEPLEFARILLNVNGLGSRQILTARDGGYFVEALVPGIEYEIYATGAGYDSDRTFYTFGNRETYNTDFILDPGNNPRLAAPQNLTAVAWTSPRVVTSSRQPVRDAKAAIQNWFNRGPSAKRPMRTIEAKDTASGNWIEVDLAWDLVRDPSLLGYGIYRGTSANGATRGIEFVRDTLTTFFADADRALSEGTRYYYEVTSLNTQYPDTDNSESGFSNRYGVLTLGDMRLRNPSFGPLTFNWQAANFAQRYTVFVFDRYPDFQAEALWPAPGNQAQFDAATTTGLSKVYGGPALTRGREYFYVVLGHANDLDSRTISVVGRFTAE